MSRGTEVYHGFQSESGVQENEFSINLTETDLLHDAEKAEGVGMVEEILGEADGIRKEEVEQALSSLSLSPDEERIVRKASEALVNRILEAPTEEILVAGIRGNEEKLEAAETVFGLSHEDS